MSDGVRRPDPNAEWWNVDDVAEYLKIAHMTVIQYHQDGKIPRRDKRSKTLLWRPETITSWRPEPVERNREWRRLEGKTGD
jgi:predicted site-specific integrase-resolvase